MIKYTIKCADGHSFESWFQSGDAFEKLKTASLLTCEVCGSSNVEKSLMVPGIPKKGKALSDTPPSALEKVREEIEKNSEYVGSSFALRARDIHEGVEDPKSIYGEARPHEVKSLVEDGVPILPLPFVPKKKSN